MNQRLLTEMFQKYQEGNSLEAVAQLYDVNRETLRLSFLRDPRIQSQYRELQSGPCPRIKQKASPSRADWCYLYLFQEENAPVAKFGICNWWRTRERRSELHCHNGFESLRLIKVVRATAQAEKELKRLLGQETEVVAGTRMITRVLDFMNQFPEVEENGDLYFPVESLG